MVASRQAPQEAPLSTDPHAIAATSLRLAAAAVGSATLAHSHWTIDATCHALDGAADVLGQDPWSVAQRVAVGEAVEEVLAAVPRTERRRAGDVGRGVASLVWMIRGWMA